MAYAIKEYENAFFTLVYSGSVSLQERKEALESICRIVASKGYLKGMIDVRNVEMAMSTEEQVEFAHLLAGRTEINGLKIAILHGHQGNPNLIIDAVAYHAGHPTVPFKCEHEARSWLLGMFT